MTPRPGQVRTGRGRRSTESAVTRIGRAQVKVKSPRDPAPLTLDFPDPRDYAPAERLVTQIATTWQAHYNTGSSLVARRARQGLVILADMLREQRYTSWDQLSLEALVDLEDTLTTAARALIMPIWRALRSVPSDSQCGYFTPEVARFLASNRGEQNLQTTPTEPLPAATLKQVLRAALSDVSIAEGRIGRARWDGSSNPPVSALLLTHEVMAFFVLLAFEWNMSIDVIASLRFDDTSPTRVLDWGHATLPSVQVRWFKNRGKTSGQLTMLADQPLRAGSLLRRLRDASAANRFVARTHGWDAVPWLCAYESLFMPQRGGTPRRHPANNGAPSPDSDTWTISSVFTRSDSSMLNWCQRTRKPGLAIQLPERYTRDEDRDKLSYRVIRPAAKWAKFVASGKGLLLGELVDDNTVQVLSAHYLNSETAMRDIGEAWADITTLAEEVARGLRPTAVDSSGNVVSGPPGVSLNDTRVGQALGGELKAGMASCLDILNSPQPGERPGQPCTSAWRACFSCRNSVVTPDDIPGFKLFLLLAEKAHGHLSPHEWAVHWGRTVRWIMHVMPLMDPNWEQQPIAPRGVFDLGLEAGPA